MCGLCHGAGMARKCYADLNAAVYFYLQTKQRLFKNMQRRSRRKSNNFAHDKIVMVREER